MFFAALTSAFSVYAQATQRKRAWLSRLSDATCPHAEQRWLVNAGLTLSTLPGALSSRRRASRPQPERLIARFRAALAATLRPGALIVPRAERVMLLMRRSSMRITSKRRAISVEVFSHQSLRRSASRAFRRPTASLTFRPRADPRRALASIR